MHFKNLDNLRTVAVGCLRGLSLLCDAGVVHCDMKVGKCGIGYAVHHPGLVTEILSRLKLAGT